MFVRYKNDAFGKWYYEHRFVGFRVGEVHEIAEYAIWCKKENRWKLISLEGFKKLMNEMSLNFSKMIAQVNALAISARMATQSINVLAKGGR